MDTNSKIQLFISETGASQKEARSMLQERKWNVEDAIRSYKFLQHAARPPQGPLKNKEPPPASQNVPQSKTYTVNMTDASRSPVTVRATDSSRSPTVVTVKDSSQSGAGLGAVVGGSRLAAQGVTGGTGQVPMPASPKVKAVTPPGKENSGSTEKLTVNGAVLRAPSSPGTLNRRLMRGLSKTSENLHLVSKARDIVLNDIAEDSFVQDDGFEDAAAKLHFEDTPEFTFILPDLTRYPEDFRAFLHKDLIETSTLVSLEQAGRLNWWADIGACQRLLPLATTGDGNCLLHAASLGMWGFHDRHLTLRKALYARMSHAGKGGSLWRRWRWHQQLVNKQSGLIYDENEWDTEWNSLLRLASSEPRIQPGGRGSCCESAVTNGLMERGDDNGDNSSEEEIFYESLEELHVFVLAHVLRRPIIVVADTILKDSDGEALAPIPFGGIYLPLDTIPEKCHRSPLLLTYDAAHFSALVPMEGQGKDTVPKPAAAIPLVDPEFQLLPIHFMMDPGPTFDWGVSDGSPDELSTESRLQLISQYLEVEQVLLPSTALSPSDAADSSEDRPRANSWSSSRPHLIRTLSIESDESNNSKEGSNGNSKDSKEKTKMAKQMQSVAKSFGSIGKTMSKKLKKNFGGAGKSGKKKQSVGSVTQSTKTVGISVEMLKDKGHLVCCHLLHRRLHYQQRIVDNYLQEAQERFEEDREIRRQQEEEIRSKVGQGEVIMRTKTNMPASPKQQECINRDCHGVGSAATCYLCPRCYQNQRSEELHRSSQVPHHLPMTVGQAKMMQPSRPQSEFQRQNTMVTSGKSKFYTYSDEDHVSPVNDVYYHGDGDASPQSPNNREFLNNYSSGCWPGKAYSELDNVSPKNSTVKLARSSFYDEPLSMNARNDSVQPGTAVVVRNNLHDNQRSDRLLQKSSNQAKSKSPDQSMFRHAKQHHLSDMEPPLRPEFEKMSRKTQSAYVVNKDLPNDKMTNSLPYKRISPNSEVDYPQIQGKYITLVNVNVEGKEVHKSDYKDPRSKCVTHGCEFFGTEIQDNLCSKCYKEKQRSLAYYAERQTTL